eukprot:8622659-Pyramimonas_sp.AAC.2
MPTKRQPISSSNETRNFFYCTLLSRASMRPSRCGSSSMVVTESALIWPATVRHRRLSQRTRAGHR